MPLNIDVGSKVQTKRTTVRDKLDKLHMLLTDSLTSAIQIGGEEPAAETIAEPANDIILNAIESALDRALYKASTLATALHEIEARL